MIGNYKSSQEEKISKRKLVKVLSKYVRHAESKLKNKEFEPKDVLEQKSTSKIIKKTEHAREEAKRYLFEIELPKVSASYLHHQLTRNLSCDEIEHLCNSNFNNWKQFIIRTLFRMEFNINEPIPIKLTDRYLADKDKKSKKMKAKRLKIKQSSKNTLRESGKPKSDDTRSQGLTTEEEEEIIKKNIVLQKAEAEKVEKAQKNIQFWFD